MWSVRDLLAWTEGHFRERGIESPRLDAELLLAHALECKRLDLYLGHDRPVAAAERDRFRALEISDSIALPNLHFRAHSMPSMPAPNLI